MPILIFSPVPNNYETPFMYFKLAKVCTTTCSVLQLVASCSTYLYSLGLLYIGNWFLNPLRSNLLVNLLSSSSEAQKKRDKKALRIT